MVKPSHGVRQKSNRAEGYDYAGAGSYYVTICTHELQSIFGHIEDGMMVTNAFGQIVTEEWLRIAAAPPDIELDAFVIMPNHFHGIIVIHDAEPLVRATPCVALGAKAPAVSANETCGRQAAPSGPRATHGVARTNVGGSPRAQSLGVIVGQIKSASSRRINRLRETPAATIWHRNYYDHIIRNEKDLDRVRTYIANNPANWRFDRANRLPKETLTP
ncbi:MAG: transposase [Chloroflexia bacterium]|nr:transposase [Chloroflexia bacterium]